MIIVDEGFLMLSRIYINSMRRTTMLKVGTKAPEFSLPDQNGEMHTLKEYAGKKVILYFYPKDNTPGCTNQACSFSTLYPQFMEKGAVVLGISKDSVASHKKFAEKYNLFRHEHFISAEHSLKTSSEMIAQLLSLANCHKTDNPYRGIEMLIHLYSCFLIYAQYIDSLPSSLASLSKPRNKEAVQKINTACNYIAKCCTQPLSLDEVADYTGFNIYYFSRLFKQVTGYSFTEYLAKQRIAYAQRLLSDSTLSITEIAFQAGFKSIPTFNRVFKRLEGYSPSEFKEMYANS